MSQRARPGLSAVRPWGSTRGLCPQPSLRCLIPPETRGVQLRQGLIPGFAETDGESCSADQVSESWSVEGELKMHASPLHLDPRHRFFRILRTLYTGFHPRSSMECSWTLYLDSVNSVGYRVGSVSKARCRPSWQGQLDCSCHAQRWATCATQRSVQSLAFQGVPGNSLPSPFEAIRRPACCSLALSARSGMRHFASILRFVYHIPFSTK